jgi:hypothetical protein
VNNSWLRVPMADVLFAGDQYWWQQYHHDVEQGFDGECWTVDLWTAHEYGLHFVQSYDHPGLSTQIGVVHTGSNSGYAAVNLAYLFGAKRIVLVGYDYQRTYGQDHWHGMHVNTLGKLPVGKMVSGDLEEMPDWIARFRTLAFDLQERGVRMMNASLETAIDCVERLDLEEALNADEPAYAAPA